MTQIGLPRVRGVTDWSAALRGGCELVPWGWTERLAQRAVRQLVPDASAVRISNSRSWSLDLEREMTVALPGSTRLERIDDFAAIVDRASSEFGRQAANQTWVVKANFGMAGRERLLGRGIELSDAQRNWLQRRINADGAVYFEPWLPLRAEVGVQWQVMRLGSGPPRFVGLAQLLTDAVGNYRGSRISLDTTIPPEWQQAVEFTERAAERLQQIGYFGPLGIDSAIVDDNHGRSILRPLQDINARYTMGRLALGLCRCLQPGEIAEWRHDVAGIVNESPNEPRRRIAIPLPRACKKPREELVCACWSRTSDQSMGGTAATSNSANVERYGISP
jgi:hypothetical protein